MKYTVDVQSVRVDVKPSGMHQMLGVPHFGTRWKTHSAAMLGARCVRDTGNVDVRSSWASPPGADGQLSQVVSSNDVNYKTPPW